MNSIYSKRLYYYLKLYEDKGIRIDDIEVLRAKLECPQGYKKFADFNRYVLKSAYEEINGNSDISFEYEPKKTGKKVTHMLFDIKSRKIITPTQINVDEEISCTISEDKKQTNNIETIKLIIKNIIGEIITDKSANEIYQCAIKHKEYDNDPLALNK